MTEELKRRARELLAKAYRDNGDIGGARYVEAGNDIWPDTQIALLAITDALSASPKPQPDDTDGLVERVRNDTIDRLADYLDGYAGGHYMAQSCASALRALKGSGNG